MYVMKIFNMYNLEKILAYNSIFYKTVNYNSM